MKNRYLLILLVSMMFCGCTEILSRKDRRNGAYRIPRKDVPHESGLMRIKWKYNVYPDTVYVFRVQDITKCNSEYRANATNFAITKSGRLVGANDTYERNLCLVTDKYGNLQEMELGYNTEVGDTLIIKRMRHGYVLDIVNLTLQNKAKAFLRQR